LSKGVDPGEQRKAGKLRFTPLDATGLFVALAAGAGLVLGIERAKPFWRKRLTTPGIGVLRAA